MRCDGACGPDPKEEAMTVYAALDVSMKTTTIPIADAAGKRLWQCKAATHPDAIAEALRPFASDLALVGLETGPWTTWLWHGLRDHGLPAVCMDARQAKAALSLKINKTDANDACGLAQLLRTGLFRKVRVKGWDDMRVRTLVRARPTSARSSSPCSRRGARLAGRCTSTTGSSAPPCAATRGAAC
jgi:transposase